MPPSLARQTIVYTPEGGTPVTLCLQGDTIMEDATRMVPALNVEAVSILYRRYAALRQRPGATMTMTMTVATAHANLAVGEAWGEDMREGLLLAPIGALTVLSCYYQGDPQRTRVYDAAVSKVEPFPLSSDHMYSGRAAWYAIALEFILTNPH